MNRKALGRGLGALLGSPAAETEDVRVVQIDRIVPNAMQPRREFDEAALSDLARSIEQHGVVQPLIVRPASDGLFQLVAGERRLRASRLAGLTQVPVVVRPDEGRQADLELALIENIQREDLNPLEEARAYDRLLREFKLSQEEVARRVGKSRVTIANTLRLLRLPEDIQAAVADRRLTTGHAKALLAIQDEAHLRSCAQKVIDSGMSVRQTEELAARASSEPATDRQQKTTLPADPNVRDAIHKLELAIGTKVTIQQARGKGRIEIHFFSAEEMHRLYEGLLRARF